MIAYRLLLWSLGRQSSSHVLGIWLIISLWILADVTPTAGMIWSNVVSGAVLTVLGIAAGYFGFRARTTMTVR